MKKMDALSVVYGSSRHQPHLGTLGSRRSHILELRTPRRHGGTRREGYACARASSRGRSSLSESGCAKDVMCRRVGRKSQGRPPTLPRPPHGRPTTPIQGRRRARAHWERSMHITVTETCKEGNRQGSKRREEGTVRIQARFVLPHSSLYHSPCQYSYYPTP